MRKGKKRNFAVCSRWEKKKKKFLVVCFFARPKKNKWWTVFSSQRGPDDPRIGNNITRRGQHGAFRRWNFFLMHVIYDLEYERNSSAYLNRTVVRNPIILLTFFSFRFRPRNHLVSPAILKFVRCAWLPIARVLRSLLSGAYSEPRCAKIWRSVVCDLREVFVHIFLKQMEKCYC